jgi:hypothetical protein|tara:strand:- start:511 stop:741 length:231 start_codon:yes stop_codon:yes gene_type:complete
MTRIEWLLKGDPLFSLQVARRTEPSVTIEIDAVEFIPSVLKFIPPVIEEPSLFDQLFRTTTFDGGFKGLGFRAVLP